jgi:Peptidase family M48
MPVFVPKQEWLADLEEQAKRRLQQTMSGVGGAAQEFVQGAQDKIGQELADAEKAREEMYRGIFEREMAAVRERGQQALQGIQGVGQDLGAGVQQAQEAQAAQEQTTQETTAREAAQPTAPEQALALPTPQQPQAQPPPPEPGPAPPPPPPTFQVPGLQGLQDRYAQGQALREQTQQAGPQTPPWLEEARRQQQQAGDLLPKLPVPPDAGLLERSMRSGVNAPIESINRIADPEERLRLAEALGENLGTVAQVQQAQTGLADVVEPSLRPTGEDVKRVGEEGLENSLRIAQAAGDVANVIPTPREQLENFAGNVAFAGAEEIARQRGANPAVSGAIGLVAGIGGPLAAGMAGSRFVAPRPGSSRVDGAVPTPRPEAPAGPTARDTRGILPGMNVGVPSEPGYRYASMTETELKTLDQALDGILPPGQTTFADTTLAAADLPRGGARGDDGTNTLRQALVRLPDRPDVVADGVTTRPLDSERDGLEVLGDDGAWHPVKGFTKTVQEGGQYGIPTREMGGGPEQPGGTATRPLLGPPEPGMTPGYRRGQDPALDDALGRLDAAGEEAARRSTAEADQAGAAQPPPPGETPPTWNDRAYRDRGRERWQQAYDEGIHVDDLSDDEIGRLSDRDWQREVLRRRGQPPEPAATDLDEDSLLRGQERRKWLRDFGLEDDPRFAGMTDRDLAAMDDERWTSVYEEGMGQGATPPPTPPSSPLDEGGAAVDPATVQYRRGLARAAGVDVSDLTDEDVARMDPGQWQTEVNRRRTRPPEDPESLDDFVPDSDAADPTAGMTPEEADDYWYGGSDFPGQDLSPEMQAFARTGRDRRVRAREQGLEVDWLADDELGRLGEDDFQRMLRDRAYRPFVDPRFRTTGEQAEPPSGMTEVPGEGGEPRATSPDRPTRPVNRDDLFSERIDVFEQLSPGEQQAVTDAMASGELTRNSTVGEVFDWIDRRFGPEGGQGALPRPPDQPPSPQEDWRTRQERLRQREQQHRDPLDDMTGETPNAEALGRLRREEAIRQGFGPEDLSDLDDAAIGRLTHDEWEAFQTAREAEIADHFAAGGTLEEWTGPPSDQPRGPLEGTRPMGPRDLRPEGPPPPEGPVRGMPPTPADPDYPYGGPIDLGPERRNVAETGGPSSPLDGAAAGRPRTPGEEQPGFGEEFLTRLGPASVRSGAAGGVLGGATGAATAPEDATWEERLQRGVVWGAGGAALAGGGRYVGSQALLKLAEEGRAGLRPETFTGHPDFANRVRAMMLAAADATPEGGLVRTPALLDFLRRFDLTRVRGGDEVQALLKGGLTPDEVREIVARQAPPDKVWAAGQQWLVDLLSGTGMRGLRGMERVGDVGAVRAMPLGAERGSDYRSGARVGSPEGLQEMVDQVARRLGVDRPVKVFVSDSKEPGAMAGIAADEGGDILVSQGFVDLLKAGHIPEEQALGVLAHEVGHFLPGGLSDTPIDRALRAYDRTRDRLLGPPSGGYRGATGTGGTNPPGRPRETFPEDVGPPAREPVDYEGRAVHPDDLPPDLVAEEAQQLSRAYATRINDIRAAADDLPAGADKDALVALANKMRQDYIGGVMGRLSPAEKARQNKLENLRRQGRGTTQPSPPQQPQQPTPPQGQAPPGQTPPGQTPPAAPPGQTGTPPPVTTRGQGTTPTTGQTPATTPTTGPATAPPQPALDPVGFWDWVAQARYSGLLSNIYGIMGDFISGPIEGVWKLARDATMETAGAVTGRGGRPGAVIAETKAVIDVAFPEMIRLFPTIRRELGTPLTTGVGNVNPVTGLPQRTASTGKSDVGRDLVLRLRANNQRGQKAAVAMEMPSRARAAIDAVNSQVAHKMSLARQAYHDVANQGIDPWSAQGKAAREQLMQNPTQAMIDTAIEDADRLTFRNDPGAFGNLLANAAHHPLGNILMPIVRTPYNIAQRGMERTPLGLVGIGRDMATGSGSLRQRWANVDRGDERLTDVILGTSMWLGLAAAAEAGLITGTGPDDARTRDVLRAQGWRPNSIKVGDRYVSYERIGPFAFPLALAGAYGDSYQSRRAGTGRFDSDLWLDVMQNAGYWGRNQTFLRSFGDVYESLGDFKTEAPRWVSNTALAYGSLLTGGLMSGAASALDPYERRRDVQPNEYPGGAVGAEVAYRLPALRETLPVRRDVFGERMQNPGHGIGFVAPLRGGPHRSTINRDTRSLRRYEDSRSALQDLRITRAKQAVEDFESGRSARRPSASEERMADDYSENAEYEAALRAAKEAEIERNLARSGR